METPKWTGPQKAGIETTGHSLLVSAAAGSGKTAVLAERCAHLVCDAKGAGCDVDQLLVVTFTESAAAEMKARIQAALRQRMATNPSDRLARQILLAEHAHVSTVHGFCHRLLRQNFTLAGIDPKFEVLDADEAVLLRREIATDLFQARYEYDQSGDFQRFIEAYGDGNDEALIQQVISTHGLLGSLIDPGGWIAEAADAMRQAAEKPLEESELGRDLIAQLESGLSALAGRCDDARRSVRALGREFGGYAEQMDELSSVIAHWRKVLEEDGLDMLVSEVRDFRAAKPRAPNIRGQPAGKELAKSLLDAVKNAVNENPLVDLLSSTGDEWRRGMAKVIPHARTFLSLVSDFGREYAAAKDAARALDFADMERMSLNILREGDPSRLVPSRLARSLHEQFRHVLVDEYQDINPIQDAILRLVSRESISEQNANLFCVGDVKQSIFRFRLAEPGRFLERHERFSSAKDKRKGEVIDLRENFRSRGPLLNAINGVFERLMTRQAAEIEYDQSHRLAAGRDFPPAGGEPGFAGAPIELHLLPENPGETSEGIADPEIEELERADYEAILLSRRILQMMGADGSPRMNVCKPDGSGKSAPIEYGDIVILLRAMRHKADHFADVLRAHKIPVHSEGGSGFFEATEVRDMICLLQILDNQRQDIPLAAVLRSPLAGLPDADDAMARIRLAYRDEAERIPFHEAVIRYAAEKDDELSAHLKDFLDRLRGWRDQANKRPVAELIGRLYEETGYLALSGGLDDGQQRMANLVCLHERAGQFGTFLRQGLYRFLRFLENLRQEMDIGRPSPVGPGEQVVRIMSVHRSKGLEFPVVLLPDLGKMHNLADTRGAILVDRRVGLGMAVVDQDRLIRYPSLGSTLVRQSLLRQTMSEELRLLYVAMTRAKEHLILVATCSEKARERWESQWAGHTGPLPADVVQGAKRVVEWIGPVAAMTAGAASPIFKVQEHSAADVQTWQNPRHQRPEFSERQKSMARLEKLPVDPPTGAAARQLIRRFEVGYAYDLFSRLPASASVTSLAKGKPDESTDPGKPMQRKLDLPRFFLEETSPKATDIGNATHTVLQYFDFAAGDRTEDIERQIGELVARQLLSPAHAKLVQRDAVLWFLHSDVGALVRANHAQLMRETPFALARQAPDCPATGDALDQIMIRGRIDLLIPTTSGVTVVDYKTDNVSGPAIDARVEIYSAQMRLYAEAIGKIAKKNIEAIYLVFLTPRLIVKV